MMRFTLPRDIYYGKDSLEDFKNCKGKESNSRYRWWLYEACRFRR